MNASSYDACTCVFVCACAAPARGLVRQLARGGDSPEQQRSRAYESRASPAASAGHDSGTYMDRTHGSGGGDGMGGGAGGTAAAAARVRERPDSVCQAALETRNEGETLSLRQMGCALAPRTHVDFTCQEAYNETGRRLGPSHGTSPPSILSS
eukprot:CAMPEP_0185477082 /NCGR_PEP_ID=MMETSP1366-20130426/3745_1 /TAXON_ID=38817 /ORGANISM="Gephyrocapsa oceanica, Strain RCC1303" /LENGTH=152 /DNA_ID=CAMNT_0028084177 /DNA_START=90 /DNA_END=547 /DNA_ORIENTATION=+